MVNALLPAGLDGSVSLLGLRDSRTAPLLKSNGIKLCPNSIAIVIKLDNYLTQCLSVKTLFCESFIRTHFDCEVVLNFGVVVGQPSWMSGVCASADASRWKLYAACRTRGLPTVVSECARDIHRNDIDLRRPTSPGDSRPYATRAFGCGWDIFLLAASGRGTPTSVYFRVILNLMRTYLARN